LSLLEIGNRQQHALVVLVCQALAEATRPGRALFAGAELSVGLGRLAEAKEVEERSDLVPALRGVSHRVLTVDLVTVSTPHSLAREEAGCDEVGDDPLHGSLGDPDVIGYVAKAHVRVIRDAEQDLGVVRDERPARRCLTT
jgi:hypothetical protein